MRINLSIKEEIKDIIIADVVLIIAFAFTYIHGIFGMQSAGWFSKFIFILPIIAFGVTLSFILHELMHRFVAQHYGAIAGFKSSRMGLIVTLATGLFGFLLGIPGATMIYVHNFSKRENGIVSLAGPLTNFFIFGLFFIIYIIFQPAPNSYLADIISFTLFISILLAFFNMLPIPPLDGSKVLAWNPIIYIITMAIIFGIMLEFSMLPLTTLVYMIMIAIFFSLIYRNLIF